MKALIRNTAAAALISAFLAPAAFAMTATDASLRDDLQAAHLAGADTLNVTIQDGVATISGYVTDNGSRLKAERIVQNSEGVTEVINLVTGN